MNEYELPLVFFTVLCQWAVGSIVALTVLFARQPGRLNDGAWMKRLPAVAVAIALIHMFGTALSLLHLGSPLQAYNSILGAAHSWLSREILAFIVSNIVIVLWAATVLYARHNTALLKKMSLFASVVGLAAVLVSAQVYYQVSSHPLWHSLVTHLSFIATTLLLGFLSISVWVNLGDRSPAQNAPHTPASLLMGVFVGVLLTALTMLWYGQGLLQTGELQQSAQLIIGSKLFGWQLLAGVLTAAITAAYLLKCASLSRGSACLVVLLVLSAAISGRMLFYSGVMQLSPWV